MPLSNDALEQLVNALTNRVGDLEALQAADKVQADADRAEIRQLSSTTDLAISQVAVAGQNQVADQSAVNVGINNRIDNTDAEAQRAHERIDATEAPVP